MEDCKKALDECVAELQQADLGSVPRCINVPVITNATNIDRFLDILIFSNVSGSKRFVLASSSFSYGEKKNA